jgi:hypothetical protein
MMSGFIGQFLPLSGGSLGGALSLGGNDLDYLGNIKDSAGSTRIQIINSGTNRALNFLDDAANVMMTVNENGVSVAGFLSLAANDGLGIDGVGLFFGDGSGNLEIDGTTVLIVPTVTGSSGTIAGVRVNAGLTISGSVTAIGTETTASFSGSTTGKKWIETWSTGTSAFSGIDTNGNFIKSSFTSAQAIYVDGTNGSDTKGNGTDVGPFATIGHALSFATSGMCVIVGPGNYNVTQVVCPNGVSLYGSGMDVTTLTCTGTAGGAMRDRWNGNRRRRYDD